MKTTLIGVGIDTARYGHHVSFLGADRVNALPGFHFKESRDGYTQLAQAFEKLAKNRPDVHFSIRVDAAGQYAANLIRFLESLAQQKSISVGQPKQNKDYKSVHFPKKKSDQVESLACARFAVVEQPVATSVIPLAIAQLREVLSALQSQTKRTTRLINQLHNRISRTFPELAVVCSDLAVGYVLALLIKYPTAQKIAASSVAKLSEIPFMRSEKAKEIYDSAKQSTASMYGASAELIVSELAKEIKASQASEAKLEKMLTEVFDELPGGNHHKILTIDGVGKLTAAAVVAAVSSIERFATPDALVNLFGVFPEHESSGTDKNGNPLPPGRAHMSKKGNDLVRKMLFMSAMSGIGSNPLLRAHYAKLRANGKDGGVALGHCMRKILHWIYAIWTTGKDFDPNYGNAKDVATETVPDSSNEQTTSDIPITHESAPAGKPKASVGRKEAGSKRKAVTADTTIVNEERTPNKQVSKKGPQGSHVPPQGSHATRYNE